MGLAAQFSLFYSKLILRKKDPVQLHQFLLSFMPCCGYCESWYWHLFEEKGQSERLLDRLDCSSRGGFEDSKLTSKFWSNRRTGMLAFYQTILLSDGKILSLVNAASFKKLFLLSPGKSMHPTAVPGQCFPESLLLFLRYNKHTSMLFLFPAHCCSNDLNQLFL